MQKQRSEDLRLAWSSEEEHKKALVFTNLQSGYLIRKRVYLHFKSAAAAIGAPDNRVHDLRHTYTVLSKITVYFQIPNIVIRCKNRLETKHFKTIFGRGRRLRIEKVNFFAFYSVHLFNFNRQISIFSSSQFINFFLVFCICGQNCGHVLWLYT